MFIRNLNRRREGRVNHPLVRLFAVGLAALTCSVGCGSGGDIRPHSQLSPRASRWNEKDIRVDLVIKNTSSKKWLVITSFMSVDRAKKLNGTSCVNYFTKADNRTTLFAVRASATLPDRSCSLSALPGCIIPLARILQPGDEISENWILNPPDRAAGWLTDKPEIPDAERFGGNYEGIKTVDIRTEYLEYADWAEVQEVYPMARETSLGEADLGYTTRWEKRKFLKWVVPVTE